MATRSKEEASVKKGDKVKAKWSGSNVFYNAVVLDAAVKQCKVQFEDGSIFSVKSADIKPLKAEAETSVGARSTRPRSRSRSRSLGRKPLSRSRSPARKTTATKAEKKPAEKKTTEKKTTEKKTAEKKTAEKKAVEKKAADKKTPAKAETNSSTLQEKDIFNEAKTISIAETSSSAFISKNSIMEKVIYSGVEQDEISEENMSNLKPRHRSARIAALQLTRANAHYHQTPDEFPELKFGPEKLIETIDKSKYSDDESESEEEMETAPQKPKRFSFLYSLTVLLKIIFTPVAVLFFSFACSKKQCTISEIPPSYSRWKEFENDVKLPLLLYSGFHACLFLLSKIPLGKEVNGFPFGAKGVTNKYRLNGFFILILLILLFPALVYFDIYMNWGYDKFKAITVVSVIYTTVWSVYLHGYLLFNKVDENHLNISYNAGSFLDSFYHGLEVNPVRYPKEDVKSRFIQVGLLGLVMLNLSVVCKFFLMKGFVPIPLALTTSMQIFFVLDYYWREETMLCSATYTRDGVGYGFLMGIGSVIPSTLALQVVYLANYSTKAHSLPHWCSAAIVALFFCGYFMYLSSSNLKLKFRRAPFSPALSYVESIPTSKRKRLIISSWWGIVRHPNYLGLIIMVIAWSLPCGFTHIVPYGPTILIIATLILRSFKIEAACQQKYGPAWKTYTDRVRSRIIPYVF